MFSEEQTLLGEFPRYGTARRDGEFPQKQPARLQGLTGVAVID